MKRIKLPLLILMIAMVFSGNTYAESRQGISRLIRKNASERQDTVAINSLIREGFNTLAKKVVPQRIKEIIDSAIFLCEKREVEIPSQLYLLRAEYHYFTGDYRSASEDAVEALKLSSSEGDRKTLAKTNLFLGKYYNLTRYYKESIEYYESGISIAKKENLKGVIPAAYMGQATVFESVGDLNAYRQNLQLMIDASFEENDSLRAALGYSILGTSYCGDSETSVRRDFGKADSLLKRSIAVAASIKDHGRMAYALANSGWNFYLERMYDSSLFYYERSLKYSLPSQNYSGASNSLGNIGTIYRDLNQPVRAIGYYTKAIEQAEKVDDVYNLRWIYDDMSKLYINLGDTSNAYKTYVLFKKYSDIYLTGEKSKGLADAKLQYDADMQNQEVELLSLKLKNNRLLNYGFAGFAVLSVVIAYLLHRAARLKNKRRISEMNRKISEITQANLRQQMNPHFIFNTLNSIQYYMYQHDKLATNNYLTKFSNLMRKVLENSQHTYIPLSDELNALSLYLELECIRFRDKFEFEIKVDEEIDPLMYKVPTMLIQPYVENSINHGLMPLEGKGFVKIDILLKKDHLLCTVEDNGIGREAAREINNRKGTNHNSLGTQITASRLELVNALYGNNLRTTYTDLHDSTGEAAGTRVEIHIPII